MKTNEKGFTLIEILAAVTILGILMGVAVAGVTRYQEQAREEAYSAMEKSAFDAAQNYVQKASPVIPNEDNDGDPTDGFQITINTLVTQGYLPTLADPATKSANCHTGSTVYVSKIKGSGQKLDQYIYYVIIKCADYISTHTEKQANGTEKVVNGVYFYS